MQLGPINPTVKAPGSKRLKLTHEEPLSKFAFKFSLRRYTKAINIILQPVRDHFTNDKEAKSLLDQIKKYKVTKG